MKKWCFVVFSFFAAVNAYAEDQVVLKTDDFVVTVEDFDRYLAERGVTEERKAAVLSKEGAVKNLFENLYVLRAFANKAEANDQIDKDEIAWLVKNYRERVLMNRQLELEVNDAIADIDWEEAAREEYLANKDQYKMPEQVNVDHILIGFSEYSEDEALARAREVEKRLEDGEDFEALAREYSDDAGSKASGGKLGFFGRGKMVKAFEDAAFAMSEPGQISDPVKTNFGYHILRFNEHRPEQPLTFDKVKKQLIGSVKQKTIQATRAQKIDDVKRGKVDLGLEINGPLLHEIESKYEKSTDKPAN